MRALSADQSDVEVLAAVADGDRSALRVLYDRHAPWLALRLARRCADPGVVDETIQDTFLAVWRGAGRYKGQGDVGAWIWGIAIRRLIDALRRLPRGQVLVAEVDDRRSAEEEILLGVEYGDLGALIALGVAAIALGVPHGPEPLPGLGPPPDGGQRYTVRPVDLAQGPLYLGRQPRPLRAGVDDVRLEHRGP